MNGKIGIRAAVVALLAAGALGASASEADTVVTFDWVPIAENPASGPSTASGSITLDFASWSQSTPSGPNVGPFFTSGADTLATITAFSYTDGSGTHVGLSNLSSTSLTSSIGWSTSAIAQPATGAQAPSAPTSGFYLVTSFGESGTTALGTAFSIGNNTGVPGTTVGNQIGNGGNNFQPVNGLPAIADGGYWKLETTPVPLPAALPLLLTGLGGLSTLRRRRLALA